MLLDVVVGHSSVIVRVSMVVIMSVVVRVSVVVIMSVVVRVSVLVTVFVKLVVKFTTLVTGGKLVVSTIVSVHVSVAVTVVITGTTIVFTLSDFSQICGAQCHSLLTSH